MNLKAIAECALPQTYTEVCAFLGLVGHYRKFIKGFAHIEQPLGAYLAGEGSSTKLEQYLPYQSFLVRMDSNPLTYIMATPNLDAMGYQWVSALAQFNFELEYQKGHDNTVADALS